LILKTASKAVHWVVFRATLRNVRLTGVRENLLAKGRLEKIRIFVRVQGAVLSRSIGRPLAAATAEQKPLECRKPLMSIAESAATPRLVKHWDKKTIFRGARKVLPDGIKQPLPLRCRAAQRQLGHITYSTLSLDG
jgi:hypothetical protein